MAKINLIDVDGKTPNLALMKISAYHKSIGDNVKWHQPIFDWQADKIYVSKIFTFTPDYPYVLPKCDIIKGGTGYDVKSKLPPEIEKCEPDYTIYPNHPQDTAIGFITRGCIRKCDFCLVHEKEGNLHYNQSIEEITQGRKNAILLDNNILACPQGIQEIEKIAQLGIHVDFNQGLDHRLITDEIAKLLAKVKWLRPLRMACDTIESLDTILPAIQLLRFNNVTPRNYFVYVLAKDIESTLVRVEQLRDWKCDPYVQTYIDFRTGKRANKQIERLERYVNHKAIFKSISWEEYKYNR